MLKVAWHVAIWFYVAMFDLMGQCCSYVACETHKWRRGPNHCLWALPRSRLMPMDTLYLYLLFLNVHFWIFKLWIGMYYPLVRWIMTMFTQDDDSRVNNSDEAEWSFVDPKTTTTSWWKILMFLFAPNQSPIISRTIPQIIFKIIISPIIFPVAYRLTQMMDCKLLNLNWQWSSKQQDHGDHAL